MSLRSADAVEARLADWLARQGWADAAVSPLTGDLSSRRYFRVRLATGATLVAAHYPHELAASQVRFAGAALLLERHGVRVPARVVDDPAAGFCLLEDLGPATLYERAELGWPEREAFYLDALEAARRIAALPAVEVAALGSPPLDAALLRRELEPVLRLFLAPHGLASEAFVAALGALCERLGADALVPCHRDLMVRNLVPLAGDRVAVLDFQDLRLGPPAYDLASLLNDSWFPPEPVERRWVEQYLPHGVANIQYRRAVVQRSLKAVGTFVSFAERGLPRHLPLVAPTLARAIRHLPELPETAESFAPLAGGLAARARADAFC